MGDLGSVERHILQPSSNTTYVGSTPGSTTTCCVSLNFETPETRFLTILGD